jgi:NAD(P)H-hydrate epimerase
MQEHLFQTSDGQPVTAVTSEEMRAVDRVAVEEVGLELLQMMENAGRNLAGAVREHCDDADAVVVLAGDGGNGGGGLACARHLTNHGTPVSVVLDRPADELTGAAATQYGVLDAMDVSVAIAPDEFSTGGLVVDALVGYGLGGPLRGAAAKLVKAIPDRPTVVSLDVPTGRDATTGEEPGVAVDADHVVTLALPKTGLAGLDGSLILADIAVPSVVYDRLDVPCGSVFDGEYLATLVEQ